MLTTTTKVSSTMKTLRDALVLRLVFGPSWRAAQLGTPFRRGWRARLYLWWLNRTWRES